jgi:iron complex outermembrane receptor protein
MKHPLILILIALFCHSMAIGQAGVINQKFTDDQHKPIEGLFVQLMKASDSSLVFSSFSDAKGEVQFINVKEGVYFTYIAPFTYEAYRSFKIVVNHAQLIVTVPDALLQSKALKEVTVTAQVPFIQRQPDMTVVNVDKSPMNSGSSTLDVLERSPGIIIDQNDNINLQGKTGVTVMIDGKKVAMSGSELADMLRGMPADAIEKIELINNPGVQYDAAGTGGIINIVLKKGKLLGFNGAILAGYSQGVYPKATEGFTLNDGTRRFNLFLNYTYSYRMNLKSINMDQDFYNNGQLIESTQQYSYYKIPNYYNTIHTGADFFASERTTIGFVTDGLFRRYQYNESSNSITDSVGVPQAYSNSIASDNGTESQFTGELNFKHKCDSAGTKLLSAVADYMNYGFHDVQQFMNSYGTNENSYAQPPLLYGQIPFVDQTYIFQADYTTPLKGKDKLDVGVKTSYISINANTQFFLGANNLAPIDTSQTENFEYTQYIYAGYVNYSKTLKRGSFSVGLRSEQTYATGRLLTTGGEINQHYLYWFPHLTYSDTLSRFNNLEASAGTRFNRPDYDELNPFKNYINPTTYDQGNPNLLPEYEYNINVADVYKSVYAFTLSYAITERPEETVHMPAPGEPDVTLITNENLQLKDYYSFSIAAYPQINKWWSTNTYASIFYNQYIADLSQTPINNGKAVFQGNSDNIFVLDKKISFEINGQYSSGGYWGYFQSSQRWTVGAGIQAKCFKDKCTVKLNISDIFFTNYFNTTSMVYNYYESYIVKRDTRVAGIGITYRFGKNYQPEEEKTKRDEMQPDSSPKGL